MSNYGDAIDDVLEDEPPALDKAIARYSPLDKVRQEVDKNLADDTKYLSLADEKEVASPGQGEHVALHPFHQTNDTSDLRLIVEGKPLYVSKVVMSLVSPALKSLIARRATGDNVDLQLPGKKYSDILEFLKCVYPDILSPVTAQNVDVILPLADEYQVRILVNKCEDFLIKDIGKTNPKPHPDKIVHMLCLAEKYALMGLQKASFEAAAKTESDLLENVQDFWDLPSVTTTSVFIRRLKLLEQCGKNIRCKIKETLNHCSLYHKGERSEGMVCTKCYAAIGKTAQAELKVI